MAMLIVQDQKNSFHLNLLLMLLQFDCPGVRALQQRCRPILLNLIDQLKGETYGFLKTGMSGMTGNVCPD